MKCTTYKEAFVLLFGRHVVDVLGGKSMAVAEIIKRAMSDMAKPNR
jgi:hypothetical protein